jgi:hypothetical protein
LALVAAGAAPVSLAFGGGSVGHMALDRNFTTRPLISILGGDGVVATVMAPDTHFAPLWRPMPILRRHDGPWPFCAAMAAHAHFAPLWRPMPILRRYGGAAPGDSTSPHAGAL